MLRVRPSHRQSFTAMKDSAPCVSALHMDTGLCKRDGGMLGLAVAP